MANFEELLPGYQSDQPSDRPKPYKIHFPIIRGDHGHVDLERMHLIWFDLLLLITAVGLEDEQQILPVGVTLTDTPQANLELIRFATRAVEVLGSGVSIRTDIEDEPSGNEANDKASEHLQLNFNYLLNR